jgi:hypothetical protein
MGKAAGRNIARRREAYGYQPFFYWDLFDLGHEAIGEINSRMHRIEDWVEKVFRASFTT